MSRDAVVLIVLVCMVSLLSGGLAHALIPHHHEALDHHGQSREAPIWVDLHNSLQHEHKKFLAVIDESVAVSFLFTIALFAVATLFRFFAPDVVTTDIFSRALRRAILPHRAFR